MRELTEEELYTLNESLKNNIGKYFKSSDYDNCYQILKYVNYGYAKINLISSKYPTPFDEIHPMAYNETNPMMFNGTQAINPKNDIEITREQFLQYFDIYVKKIREKL